MTSSPSPLLDVPAADVPAVGLPSLADLGELTDDALTGGFRVWQRRRGHRYSLDDTLTAWEAACAVPDAARILDLGCGLGSVLLMLAYKFPHATLCGIEAQAQSFALAQHNVHRNGVSHRVDLHHGDLRDPAWVSRLRDSSVDRVVGGFDLITGTPPYQPPGAGTLSPDSQRAHARVELRGGIEAYVERAATLLAPQGRVVVCGDARHPERVRAAAEASGLQLRSERLVRPAAHYKGPLFGVWVLGQSAAVTPAPVTTHPEWVARHADGRRTEAQYALRAFFDLPIDLAETPSPRQRVRRAPPVGAE